MSYCLSEKELKSLETAFDKSTQGEWFCTIYKSGNILIYVSTPDPNKVKNIIFETEGRLGKDTANFIVQAHRLMPELLADLKKAKKEAEELSKEKTRFHRAAQECLAWIEKFGNDGESFVERVYKDFGI